MSGTASIQPVAKKPKRDALQVADLPLSSDSSEADRVLKMPKPPPDLSTVYMYLAIEVGKLNTNGTPKWDRLSINQCQAVIEYVTAAQEIEDWKKKATMKTYGSDTDHRWWPDLRW